MQRIAKFEKVSLAQFLNDWVDTYGNNGEEIITEIYNNIQLPERATVGSAGYDFRLTKDITLAAGQSTKIPTGIRVEMNEGWVLKCYPRSSLGFKYRLQLDNSVGIIDRDYAYSDNEGHIFAKITNDSKDKKLLQLKAGDAFMQGVFVEYGITVDDAAVGVRNGGLGSTNNTVLN